MNQALPLEGSGETCAGEVLADNMDRGDSGLGLGGRSPANSACR